MGTSGTSIIADDTVADVVAEVVDRLKEGASLRQASDSALSSFRRLLEDTDDGPLVWLALAHVQWKYGSVDSQVLEQVRTDITSERGLDRWREDPASLEKRRSVLRKFFEKISSANPKPAAPPRLIVRLAPFAAGDCLSVLTGDGQFTAAIVLEVSNLHREYGSNLVGSLDYLSWQPPNQEEFERRRWLYKHHGNWNGAQELCWYHPVGLRRERKRFAVVGTTKLRFGDPKECTMYSSWKLLGEQIHLCRKSTP